MISPILPHIKEQLEQNEQRVKDQKPPVKIKTPQIPLLEKLEEEIRARTYVDFMRYVAIAQTEPDLQPTDSIHDPWH